MGNIMFYENILPQEVREINVETGNKSVR